jgi:hypothetical protein
VVVEDADVVEDVEDVVLEVSLLLVDEELELPPHPVNRDAVIHILKTVAKNLFFFIRPLLYILFIISTCHAC